MKYQDLERSPGYQLWLATNAFQRIMRKALEPLHLTHVQLVLLASIDLLQSEGSPQSANFVTQSNVSHFAGTDENMTSQVIRSLAGRGLVIRSDHPTDARARCLSLTPQGQRMLSDARAVVLPARDRFFAPLGEQAVDLAGLLRKVVDGNAEQV